MKRINEAIEILKELGLPKAQQNERSGLTLLALAGIGPKGRWKHSKQVPLRTVDIMQFMRETYKKDYKPNSRETIRRQTLHQFEQARVADRNPDDSSRPTNSEKNCYALSHAALKVIRTFGTRTFSKERDQFINEFGSLREAYKRTRSSKEVPLILPNGKKINLSPGEHNQLQAAVIEQLGPRFAPGAEVLYLGDTASKHLVFEKGGLAKAGVPITLHDKLPDVVLYWANKNWLFLIEAVTSHGPVSEKRRAELESMLSKSSVSRVYVTAFMTRSEFRKYAGEIAWETEVWIAENPGHMIHFDGLKFLGPFNE